MTPDEAAESALVTHRQFARERPRPSSPPLPWLSSGTTRERIPSEPRTFHGEVGSSRNEWSAYSSESSSSSQSEGAMKSLDKLSREPYTPDKSLEENLYNHGQGSGINFTAYKELEVKVTGLDSPGMITSLGMMALDERIM